MVVMVVMVVMMVVMVVVVIALVGGHAVQRGSAEGAWRARKTSQTRRTTQTDQETRRGDLGPHAHQRKLPKRHQNCSKRTCTPDFANTELPKQTMYRAFSIMRIPTQHAHGTKTGTIKTIKNATRAWGRLGVGASSSPLDLPG